MRLPNAYTCMAKTFEYKYSLIAAANVSNIWVFENLLTTDTYSYKIVFVGVFFSSEYF